MPTTERRLKVVNGSLPEPPYPEGILARGWTFDLNVERIWQSSTWIKCPAEIRPWLVVLWMTSWMNAPCGTYPDDDEVIAGRIQMPFNLFRVHREVLMRGWERCSDGRLYHDVVTELVMRMISSRKSDRIRQARYASKTPSQHNQHDIQNLTRESGGLTRTNVLPPHPHPKAIKKNTSPIASAEFENFWTSYGKKVGRQAALREWAKLDPKDDLLAKILQASISQAKTTEQKFRKDPERWLRDRRWEDQRQQALMPPGQTPARNWAKSPGV